jgi:hypothetical protein
MDRAAAFPRHAQKTRQATVSWAILEKLARSEGFEPPALRFVV